MPTGGTRGSREGDATLPGPTLARSFHELEALDGLLQAGAHVIEFELAEGGSVDLAGAGRLAVTDYIAR